jgi:hypothetical protein
MIAAGRHSRREHRPYTRSARDPRWQRTVTGCRRAAAQTLEIRPASRVDADELALEHDFAAGLRRGDHRQLRDLLQVVGPPSGPDRGELVLLTEIHARSDLANDNRRDDPVDDHAEWRPPSGVGDEVASVLP